MQNLGWTKGEIVRVETDDKCGGAGIRKVIVPPKPNGSP